MNRSVNLARNVNGSMKNPDFYTFDIHENPGWADPAARQGEQRQTVKRSKMAYFSLNLPNYSVT